MRRTTQGHQRLANQGGGERKFDRAMTETGQLPLDVFVGSISTVISHSSVVVAPKTVLKNGVAPVTQTALEGAKLVSKSGLASVAQTVLEAARTAVGERARLALHGLVRLLHP